MVAPRIYQADNENENSGNRIVECGRSCDQLFHRIQKMSETHRELCSFDVFSQKTCRHVKLSEVFSCERLLSDLLVYYPKFTSLI